MRRELLQQQSVSETWQKKKLRMFGSRIAFVEPLICKIKTLVDTPMDPWAAGEESLLLVSHVQSLARGSNI